MYIVKISAARGDYSDPDYVGIFHTRVAAKLWIDNYAGHNAELRGMCEIVSLQSRDMYPQ